MHKRSYYIVNGITFYRLAASPLLFLLIFTHHTELFKWLLALSFFTDAIDGYLARRYKIVSVLGARLDSISDDLTIAAAVTAVFLLKPDFLKQELLLIALMVVLYLLQTVLALIRYGRISSFHTYAAKAAAVLQAIFLVLLFFIEKPIYPLFYATAFVTIIDLIEEIILVLILAEWEHDVKGLWWVLRRKNEQ